VIGCHARSSFRCTRKLRFGETAAQYGRKEQIVPLVSPSLSVDFSTIVPPSLRFSSTSVDGAGIGQYGTLARSPAEVITNVLLFSFANQLAQRRTAMAA
jgi:hypothetical protein